MSARFRAIDVLRGLTLCLMIIVNMQIGPGHSYVPLLHSPWNGLTPTDLVFPTFLFVVGTALSFTLQKYAAQGSAAVLRKVATRTTLIFLCGYLLYWYPFFTVDAGGHFELAPIASTRIPGVLQRIALGYAAATLIVYYTGRRGAVVFSVVALLAYWAVMYSFGDYSMTGSAEFKLDKLLLGEPHMYHGEGIAFDPEGILSTLPAIVNVLAGYLAASYLRSHGAVPATAARLLVCGVACVAVALCWDPLFPINKKIWTSSFVLCTIGLDLGLLAILISTVPEERSRPWTWFFEVFGRNTLAIYLLAELGQTTLQSIYVGSVTLYEWLWQAGFAPWAGDKPGSLLYATTYMLACWLVGYLMDRRRIYIKL